MSQRNQFIKDNQYVIESIQEGKRLAAYFENEDQAKLFITELSKLKE